MREHASQTAIRPTAAELAGVSPRLKSIRQGSTRQLQGSRVGRLSKMSKMSLFGGFGSSATVQDYDDWSSAYAHTVEDNHRQHDQRRAAAAKHAGTAGQYRVVKRNNRLKVVSGYSVSKTLGKGAYGEVFLARRGGEKYAIKVLKQAALKRARQGRYGSALDAVKTVCLPHAHAKAPARPRSRGPETPDPFAAGATAASRCRRRGHRRPALPMAATPTASRPLGRRSQR